MAKRLPEVADKCKSANRIRRMTDPWLITYFV
jgi:hypothetical protein